MFWCHLTLAQVVINAPPTIIPDGFVVTADQILNVSEGGQVGHNLRANDGSKVNISGGSVGLRMFANSGSEVNISGGNVGSIDGALVGSFVAFPDSAVNISGGTIGDGLEALSGSEVIISGGTVGREFDAMAGSHVTLVGGEFRLNEVEFTGDTITLRRFIDRGFVFTGTLADGSSFVFSPSSGNLGDNLVSVALRRVALPAPVLTPMIVDSPVTDGPSGLRAGESLTVETGGRLRNNFAAVDATLNVEGGTLGRNTEVSGSVVNVSSGSVGDYFYAYSGSEVNISGGSVGFRLEAFDSKVNISGGVVGSNFLAHAGSEAIVTGGRVGSIWTESGSKVTVTGGRVGTGGNLNFSLAANSGSEVHISGGAIGFAFAANEGSDVELVGGEFRLNGVDYAGSSITLGSGDIFTGTLSDGSSFSFSPLAGDQMHGVKLTRMTLPAIDLMPKIVSSPVESGPSGLRSGQTLTVQAGGVLRENFSVVNATLNVDGGVVAAGVEVVGGTVNLSSGSLGVGASLDPYVTNDFSSGFDAIDSVVNISGGVVGERSSALRGSVWNVSGGILETKFNAMAGSEMNISGGALGPDFHANAGSDVELIGGEFRLNGVNYTGNTVTLGSTDFFTGTLADGSTFVFSPLSNPLGDSLQGVKLTRVALPAVDTSPKILDSPTTGGPFGLRAGEVLTVQAGGVLPRHFAVNAATLNLEGGAGGDGLEVSQSMVNVSGGSVGDLFQVFRSQVDISGGTIGRMYAHRGATTNMRGGTVANYWSFSPTNEQAVLNLSGGTIVGYCDAYDGGVVNMSGGEIQGSLGIASGTGNITGGIVRGSLNINNNSQVDITGGMIAGNITTTSSPGTQVNISGGRMEGAIEIDEDVEFNLFGRQFYLDGVPIMGLSVGEPYTISQRDVMLTGILADGSPFDIRLATTRITLAADFVDPEAIITVTLVVPEPAGGMTLMGALACVGVAGGARRKRQS